VNELILLRSRRISYVLGAAILFLAAVPGKAANLVDVRVGLHREYTRVVLETDAKATYQVESSEREELVLQLSAGSRARTVASKKSAHLTSVTVGPAGAGGSEVRLALRVPVDAKMMVLTAPHRIVMDLYEMQEGGEAPPAALQPAPPTASAEAAAEEAPESATPESETETPLAAATAELVEPVAEEAEGAERKEAGAVPALSEPDPSAVLADREEAKRPVLAEPKPPTRPRRGAAQPPLAAKSGLLDRLPAPLGDPLVLAGIVVALVFVIAFLVLRRRGTVRDEEALTPFGAGEPFSVDEQPEVAEAADTDLPSTPKEAAEGSSLFDQPVETVQPLGEEEGKATVMDRDEVAAQVGEPAAAPGLSSEFERRLARLDERVEELGEVKERLERQVAAQTEELRVQRAAIARTQRILRDLTRPEEEATEPALKG
jgi:hypothetical protein